MDDSRQRLIESIEAYGSARSTNNQLLVQMAADYLIRTLDRIDVSFKDESSIEEKTAEVVE